MCRCPGDEITAPGPSADWLILARLHVCSAQLCTALLHCSRRHSAECGPALLTTLIKTNWTTESSQTIGGPTRLVLPPIALSLLLYPFSSIPFPLTIFSEHYCLTPHFYIFLHISNKTKLYAFFLNIWISDRFAGLGFCCLTYFYLIVCTTNNHSWASYRVLRCPLLPVCDN